MKRFFFFFAFSLLALKTFAVGEWRTELIKADILLGWDADFVNQQQPENSRLQPLKKNNKNTQNN